MQTYPIIDDSGTIYAFEIENSYVGPGALERVLANVPGVTQVQSRKLFAASHETIVKFTFKGEEFEVSEPFGDSSRYWIGPRETDRRFDVADINFAFQQYVPTRLARLIGDLVSLRFGSLFR